MTQRDFYSLFLNIDLDHVTNLAINAKMQKQQTVCSINLA